jgi:hypothetical protein
MSLKQKTLPEAELQQHRRRPGCENLTDAQITKMVLFENAHLATQSSQQVRATAGKDFNESVRMRL